MSDTDESSTSGFRTVAAVDARRSMWLIVAMLTGFAFLGHFNRVSISVAAKARFIGPEMLTAEQMGTVYSTFLFVYTVCMLPGGWVIDRIGPGRALAGMGLGMGFCVVLTGSLGWSGLSVASLFLPLLLVRGIAGALSTPLHPGAARSVSLWVPAKHRSTANGLVTAGALVGISLTYPGFGWLLNRFDWPLAFVICGTVMMVFAATWLLMLRPADRKSGVRIDGDRSLAGTLSQLVQLTKNRRLVLLTLSYASLSYFQYLFFYWLEFYFGKELKLPEDSSRQASFIVTLAMAAGMALGGVTADRLSARIGPRWGSRSVAMAAMLLSGSFAWLGLLVKEPSQVVLLFSLALGSLGLCEGIFWTAAPALEPGNGGLACAFLNTIGNAGGILAPVCTPWIGERYGWPTAITVASAICAMGAVFWFWIDFDPEHSIQTSRAAMTTGATEPSEVS